uniref:Reactive oxygen species modulator 1 n=2 Tax=Acrobeloides nanus TaxID=290746 RepID=A0A914DBU7_9BILA
MPVGGVPQGYQVAGGGQQPTCGQKLKFGFMMGATIGAGIGLLLGGYGAFASRLRGREAFRMIGKTIVQSGGSFGVFMAIAQGIRC